MIYIPEKCILMNSLDRNEKIKRSINFFNELANFLSDSHELLGSINNDSSLYLIPKDSEEQVNYYYKPVYSFRYSDHWNWYSSLSKNHNKNYIQCESVDAPVPNRREVPWRSSEPVKAIQVCIFGKDKKYHCVYGECYDRKTKTWSWIETQVDICKELNLEVK